VDAGQTDRDRVLVVDDDADVRTALTRGLRRLGYDVVLAEDGDQALEKVAHSFPKVIITDLRMPGMDGHTLLRRLVSQRVQAPVIVISGHGTKEDVVDALRAGAVDFLEKPFSQAALASAVARAVEVAEERAILRRSTPPP